MTERTMGMGVEEPVILKGRPIRRFADSGIQDAIDRQLETMPKDVHGAAIAYADRDGARVAVMGRKGRLGWTVVADKPWSGRLELEAAIRYTWVLVVIAGGVGCRL